MKKETALKASRVLIAASQALVVVVLAALTAATFVLRQDISLMLTLHQMRAVDGPTNAYRIDYCDDGWVLIERIESYELRYHTRDEEEARFPAAGPDLAPISGDDAASMVRTPEPDG